MLVPTGILGQGYPLHIQPYIQSTHSPLVWPKTEETSQDSQEQLRPCLHPSRIFTHPCIKDKYLVWEASPGLHNTWETDSLPPI